MYQKIRWCRMINIIKIKCKKLYRLYKKTQKKNHWNLALYCQFVPLEKELTSKSYRGAYTCSNVLCVEAVNVSQLLEQFSVAQKSQKYDINSLLHHSLFLCELDSKTVSFKFLLKLPLMCRTCHFFNIEFERRYDKRISSKIFQIIEDLKPVKTIN